MDNRIRIVVLWGLFVIGLILQTLIGVLPLFFGESITLADATGTMPSNINRETLVVCLIPMFSITCVLYISQKIYKLINLILSGLITGLCVAHFLEELSVDYVQATLVGSMLFFCILLTLASYHWFQETVK